MYCKVHMFIVYILVPWFKMMKNESKRAVWKKKGIRTRIGELEIIK
ncbi:hypothetical protein Hanom_Chr08g00718761 [Helianthus anomalus]